MSTSGWQIERDVDGAPFRLSWSCLDIARQVADTQLVVAYVQARPMVWIPWRELEGVTNGPAWRTRVSDARKLLEKHGVGTIRWNGQNKASCYRFEPTQPERVSTPARQLNMFVPVVA